jgi:cell division septation protein DedD
MRIHILIPTLLVLGAYQTFAEDHDHSHADPENSNLLEQLGYSMMTVEDQTVAGKSVIALPVQALFVEKGKTFVLAQNEKDPENFTRWEVETGRNDGQFIETKSGVFPGDKIIIRMVDLVAYRQPSTQAGEAALAQATVAPPLEKPAALIPAPIPAVAAKPAPPAKPQAEKKAGNYEVQIGAFTKEENAKKIADQLKPNYGKTGVLVSQSKGRPLYLVRVGDFTSFRTAQDTKEKLITTGFPEAFVVDAN